MKIRIKGNSLRYRLTRSDIAGLEKTGHLEERVDFAGQPLTYALKVADIQHLEINYIGHTITLLMSASMLKELSDTDRVGFEEKGNTIYLLLEKDFTCLDNVEEDQSDNFPNPLAAEKN